MKVSVDDARAYFAHPTQHSFGITEAELPDWMDYYAGDGLCLAVHPAFWPGVVMAHIGAKPGHWGGLDATAGKLVAEVFEDTGADRIVGWVAESNRAMQAFARRCGFVVDGRFPGVCMMGRGA